ncbi:polysaccharide biosynthesis/export family protein [Alteromonas sp. KUL49]|uniref:polysaccharide biosynthesis/export family protein n=1 Tax=Alteromonas sp. KUL49 TaxID=2480798 RepID=UPI00102F2B96|nr:polysaccharide biosynthesis/export family protein [Alteromonas sp. KUL49]TAP35009.1 polysaccharide export protein [Alteromonas sp. KUL49]GEA13456.1 polysialic acid transporter KpsD [Alteromonas sp. KUL49]
MKFQKFYIGLAASLLFVFNVNSQTLEQLETLRSQALQGNTQTSVGTISPLNIQSQRTLPGATSPMSQTGQFTTQPRSGRVLPGEPTLDTVFPMTEAMDNPPFAANLFIGGFESERTDGLNENYLIAPGDKISIWIWGTVNFSDVVTVDNQGNIFIPNVGPISVSGTPAGNINQTVSAKIGQVYTSGVNIYVNLLTSTPVSVYITGPVIRPGQYAGLASDSVLYYLKRAGGIDFKRGSFRKIDIVREGDVVATADLYAFFKDGRLPSISFEDGDIILVHPIGETISISTGARNSFTFEVTESEKNGASVTHYSRPADHISHASISGVRNNTQFARYVPLAEFESLVLQSGDNVEYVADNDPQIYRINIAGSFRGASQVMVDKGTRLLDVLDHVAADGILSDSKNVFLLRESVAVKQKEIIEQGLQRLERSMYTAPIASTGEGAIRVQEAQMVSDFIARARQVEPLGRVVVSEAGQIANILLEPNDTIVIPTTTDLIHVGGEVLLPQSLVFNPEANAEDYIAWAGGFTERAEDEKILVIKSNGSVVLASVGDSTWLNSGHQTSLSAGDQVIVLPAIDPKLLQSVKDITQIMYQIAIAANAATNIVDRD